MTSTYGLSAGIVGTSALSRTTCCWSRGAIVCTCLSTVFLCSDVHGLGPLALISCSSDYFPGFHEAGTLLDGRFFFAF